MVAMNERFSIVNLGGNTRFKAVVEEVHSGDDLILMVDLNVDALYKKVRARLQGVDTPDAYKAQADTQAGAIRDRVRKLTQGKQCFVDLHQQGRGGWIITLWVMNGKGDENIQNVNGMLKEEGYIYEALQKTAGET